MISKNIHFIFRCLLLLWFCSVIDLRSFTGTLKSWAVMGYVLVPAYAIVAIGINKTNKVKPIVQLLLIIGLVYIYGRKIQTMIIKYIASLIILHMKTWPSSNREWMKWTLKKIMSWCNKDVIKELSSLVHNTNNDCEILEILLDCGITLDAKDNKGNTILHNICTKGDFSMVEYLLLNGVNVNALNNLGETPLHIACTNKDVDIVKLLIMNDANVNLFDNKGNTPFHCVINNVTQTSDCVVIAGYLLRYGVDIDSNIANDRAKNIHRIIKKEMIKKTLNNEWHLIRVLNNVIVKYL
jgi:hypothetical protein